MITNRNKSDIDDKEYIDLIIQRIKMICSKKKWKGKPLSTYRLSKLTGINESTLRYIFKGENSNIQITTLRKICKGLGVTMKLFFDSDLFEEYDQEITDS